MKKQLLLLALCTTSLFGQQMNFFTPTNYRGAFAPTPTPMWTDGWTNWDPQNTTYPTHTDVINSNITTNTTWTSSKVYLVQGPTYVLADLTIEPGTVVLFDKTYSGSALIITKSGKIFADGQSNSGVIQPIIFTSNASAGQRNLGDWGGLVILGEAQNNIPTNPASGTSVGIGYVEGLPTSSNTEYGGTNDNDNSGVLRYVRIEFGGYAYLPDKEINGLTLASVGRNTTVDYVQVSFTNDDAFEWFGGTVNAKHLVSYRNLDDDMDCDFGYRGNVQHVLIVRDPYIADQSSASTSEGFECDNDGSGSNNGPKTAAVFSNVTAIGPLRGNLQSTIDIKHQRALRLRRNSEMKIFNSVFMDFKRGLHIDGLSTEANAQLGTLKFKNNTISGCIEKYIVPSVNNFDIRTWYSNGNNDTVVSTNNILINPYSYSQPDFRPTQGSILLNGSSFSDVELGSQTIGIDENGQSYNFYPNPFIDEVMFTRTGLIVDMNGQIVVKVLEGVNNLQHLNNGVYTYITEDGEVSMIVKR
jgi:hypothetical protein